MKKTTTLLSLGLLLTSSILSEGVQATTASGTNSVSQSQNQGTTLTTKNALAQVRTSESTYDSGMYTDHFGYQPNLIFSYGPDILAGKTLQPRWSLSATTDNPSDITPLVFSFKITNEKEFTLDNLKNALKIGTEYDITSASSDGAITQELSSSEYTVTEDTDNNTLIVTLPEDTVQAHGSSFLVLFNLLPNLDDYVPQETTGITLNIDGGYGSSEVTNWWTLVQVPSPTIKAIDSSTGDVLDTSQAEGLVEYMTSSSILAPSVSGYSLDTTKSQESQNVTNDSLAGDKTVDFYYTKNPVSGGDVTAKYVDTDGNSISDDVVKSGNVGDDYTTEQKAIDGYTFKEVQGNASGKFTDQAQTVTYVYTKNPVSGGDVTAKYVDTDGNKISDDVVKSGNVGDAYNTEQKTIDEYTFKEVQGSATGTFTDQAQTVTYVYTKNNVTPNPKPDDHSDTPESSKDNGKKNASTSENKSKLPQTGDNEELSMIAMISGIFLILGTIVMILVKRKRQD